MEMTEQQPRDWAEPLTALEAMQHAETLQYFS